MGGGDGRTHSCPISKPLAELSLAYLFSSLGVAVVLAAAGRCGGGRGARRSVNTTVHGKMRAQSSFMLTTIHPRSLASVISASEKLLSYAYSRSASSW
jgi:hypothetical protein